MTKDTLTPTLIPNNMPDYRISVHRDAAADSPRVWAIVECSEADALGGWQWAPDCDSRASRLSMHVIAALIDYVAPDALRSAESTLIGVHRDLESGEVRRCVVQRQEKKRAIVVVECQAADAFGAPRWVRLWSRTVLDEDGNACRDSVDADDVISCLFPLPNLPQ